MEKSGCLLHPFSYNLSLPAKKIHRRKIFRQILLKLFEYLTVIAVDENILKSGLRSVHKDFEDFIQIFCEATIPGIKGIITRKIKAFDDYHIPAFLQEDACKRMELRQKSFK